MKLFSEPKKQLSGKLQWLTNDRLLIPLAAGVYAKEVTHAI